MAKKPNWHVFIADLQQMQSRALALGCPIAARVLNAAMNTAGWEYGGDSETAVEKLREEFGK